MSRGLPGRPTKFTPEVQAQIIEAVANGNYLEVACRAAGVSPRTLRHWQKQHEDGHPAVAEHADFFAALKKAIAIAETSSIGRIRQGEQGWQGAAWFLERRYPQRWAKRDAQAKDNADIKVSIEYIDKGPVATASPESEEDP